MQATMPGIDLRGLISNSLVEWEGHLCAVVFTAGCNWRCAYCHGAPFVEAPQDLAPVDPADVFALLEKQHRWLDGVAITGGEPTLQPGLPAFIREVKATGMKVKLETNGTRPEILEALLAENLIDCLCLDYKAPLDKRLQSVTRVDDERTALDAVQKSFALAAASGLEREYHTTLCPAFLDAAMIDAMGAALESGGLWVLQQYETDTVLDAKAAGARRFTGEELDEIERIARGWHKHVLLRRGKGLA